MSRVGLNKRLAVVRDTLFPPGSFAWRLRQLNAADLLTYNEWRERVDAWYAAIEAEHGPGGAYELLLDAVDKGDSGEWGAPELNPLALRWKLFPPGPPPSGDPMADYEAMLREGH